MSITRTTIFPVDGMSPIVLHNVPQSITVDNIIGDNGEGKVWEDTLRIEDFDVTITTLDEYSTGVPHKVVKRVDTFNSSAKTWTEGDQETYEAEEKTFDISYKGHERDFEVKVIKGGEGGGDPYYRVNPEDTLEGEDNSFMIILKDSFEEGEQLELYEGSFSPSTTHQAPYVYTIPSCVPNYGGKSCVFPNELTENHHLYTRTGVECEIEEVLTPSNITPPIPPDEYLNSDYFTPFDSEGDGVYVFISEDSSAVIEYYPLYNSALLSILNFPVFPKEWCQYFFNESTAWYYASDAWEPTGVRVSSSDSGSSPKVSIRYRWSMNDSHDLSVEEDIEISERPTPSEGGGSDEWKLGDVIKPSDWTMIFEGVCLSYTPISSSLIEKSFLYEGIYFIGLGDTFTNYATGEAYKELLHITLDLEDDKYYFAVNLEAPPEVPLEIRELTADEIEQIEDYF